MDTDEGDSRRGDSTPVCVTDSLTALSEAGWHVSRKEPASLILLADFRSRYPSLPEDLAVLCAAIDNCTNPSATAWFVCEKHLNRSSGIAFEWDEWKSLSATAALEDNDEEWAAQIRAFWDLHIPIMMSVKSGYGYAAVSLRPDRYGAVVIGSEPEFEEADIVADSVSAFVENLAAITSGAECPAHFAPFI